MNKYTHYTFTTYKRRFVLTDPTVVSEISAWFKKISKTKGFVLIAHSILGDHVHMLIEQSSTDTEMYTMKCLKGISSRWFFKKHNGLPRWHFRRLWAKSYKASKIEKINMGNVVSYIQGQKTLDGTDKRFVSRR